VFPFYQTARAAIDSVPNWNPKKNKSRNLDAAPT
jgi:hypothetical protein